MLPLRCVPDFVDFRNGSNLMMVGSDFFVRGWPSFLRLFCFCCLGFTSVCVGTSCLSQLSNWMHVLTNSTPCLLASRFAPEQPVVDTGTMRTRRRRRAGFRTRSGSYSILPCAVQRVKMAVTTNLRCQSFRSATGSLCSSTARTR